MTFSGTPADVAMIAVMAFVCGASAAVLVVASLAAMRSARSPQQNPHPLSRNGGQGR